MDSKAAEMILKLFRGRPDHVAIPNGKGFQPQKIDHPLKPDWLIQDHLGQKRCFGFYLLDTDSNVFCSAVDFDNKPETPDPEWMTKAEQVYYYLTGIGLQPLVEISQSGTAAHVWLFFEDPVPAWLIRKFWNAVSELSGVPMVEVYPRQDELSGKQLGNLIRYPLYNQSRFVDVEHEWTDLDPVEALGDVQRVDLLTIKSLLFQLTGQTAEKPQTGVTDSGLPAKVDQLTSVEHTLLGRRWRGDMQGLEDRSRSALIQSIACELVRLYVPTPEIEQAIKVWCEEHDYSKGNRDDWVGATVKKAYEFVGGKTSEDHRPSVTMQDACRRYIQDLGKESPVIASGIPSLDYSIEGVAPGEMAVIAARPSHGKTAFGLQWIDQAAFMGVPSLIISEEMSEKELTKRTLLTISRMESKDWPEEKVRLLDEMEAHYSTRATVHLEESCQSIDVVEKVVRYHVEIHGVRLVAVDYLQLLSGKSASRYEVVTDISRRLKQVATRHNIGMLVMCQLNRDIERREKHSPMLSDLRESGQIEQDADLVLFLQWPYKIDPTCDPEEYRVYCAKRRNGPINSPIVSTAFNPNRQTFGGNTPAGLWEPEAGGYQNILEGSL